ncbi:carbon monoxide dehydrogenase subunit G [Nocardioides panacis]|uniref:Carbon monoxide dehydrogenase subunit G n=1 Tax=Nocardioides panacis TaxID=2849501 RepID=A0A975T2C8_9ACTN|nr:carbon monoxide dehydrogenase subunit G [Nocardioides panacis]QWZ10231.1 carbon monoxide dehydrogenase subunit G [Nocardioides panacis]
MKIIGNAQFAADPEVVWQALNDPAVLVRCIPGCQRLEALGDDAYTLTVAAGVGSIKGVYDGQVRLTDQQQPGSFRMHAQGAGAAGTIGADVLVTLEESAAGGASVTYDADAVVGGMIGGVGQRMLVGVSKRMAEEFFRNVENVMTGAGAAAADSAGVAAADEAARPSGASRLPPDASTAAPPSTRPSPAAGTVYTAPKGNVVTAQPGGAFAQGVLVGAAAALAGAVVGAWISRRRHG